MSNLYPTEEEIMKIFFMSKEEGWASGKKGEPLMTAGFKKITFEHENYTVDDCWSNTLDSNKSSGATTIWYKHFPVWQMQYMGWYEKDVILFLKKCLMKAYSKKIFLGGRGLENVSKDKLFYLNTIFCNKFIDFSGEEKIYDTSTCDLLGCHKYQGMILI